MEGVIKKIRNAKEGMTLVEIMIVVFIGALLMAGAFWGWRLLQNVYEQQTYQKLAALDTAIELYSKRLGEYPRDLTNLIEGPQDPKLKKKFGQAFIKEDELKDAWGQEFVYELLPKGSRPPYELYSRGSTGEAKIFSPGSSQ